MQIAVLHDRLSPDARADELDTLVQVEAVSAALGRLGHEVFRLPFDLDLPAAAEALRKRSPDFVFNLVESVAGAGSLLHLAPSLLDHLGLRYTGGSAESIFATSNKLLGKKILQGAGIPTPTWLTAEALEDEAVLPIPGSWIVKSVWEHASIGLDEDSVIHEATAEKVAEVLRLRQERWGGEWFAEAFVDGREFNLSLLAGTSGPKVLPPSEILFQGYGEGKPKVVGYRAKWDEASFEYQHTARTFEMGEADGPLLQRLRRFAKSCWALFGLRGYARVDFRVDAEGQPWVLEVNANPCLSPDAGYAASLSRAGIDFDQAVQQILEDVPRRAATRKR